jgi:uncharacterized membrane protein YheB (UPF0754 family)
VVQQSSSPLPTPSTPPAPAVQTGGEVVKKPVKKADKKLNKKQNKKVKDKKLKKTNKTENQVSVKASKKAPDESETTSRKRFFRCIYTHPEKGIICEGRYSGRKPKQAASKALTSILKLYQKDNKKVDNILFGIIECTRGSKNKKYFYEGKKSQLKIPLIVKITKKDKNGNLLGEKLSVEELNQYKAKNSLSSEDIEFLTKKGYVVYKNNNVARKVPESQCSSLAKYDVKIQADA